MKKIWLVVCFFGLFVFPSLVIAECEHSFTIDRDVWCCPSWQAQMRCLSSLDPEHCYYLDCEILRREKNRDRNREDCRDLGLRYLDGRCVTDRDYKRISRQKVRDFVDKIQEKLAKERQAIVEKLHKALEKERRKAQDKARQQARDDSDKQKQQEPPKPPPKEPDNDKILPPPSRPPDREPREPAHRSGTWTCGVCRCPDQEHCRRLPNEMHPRGSFSSDTIRALKEKCKLYGCEP